MTTQTWHERMKTIQPKLHGLAVGLTLGIGSTFLGQGCPLVGQCPTCATCLPRLPLLAAPLAADAMVMLAAKLLRPKVEEDSV
jgi:hypothetical protein